MGIKAFDWNNDGLLDIYITDMHSDMSKDVAPDDEHVKSDMQWNEEHLKSGGMSVFGNTFFENRGDGRFVEISDRIGAENYWPWGVSVGDLNADGWQDVFVTQSMNYPFRYQTNSVLINDRGRTFRRAEFILGVERALNWIAIGLRGHASNRDGLGARVTVTTADSSYMQVMDGKSGYLSQSSLPLYFGLGDAQSIDSIRVDWPSGITQTVTNAATNAFLEIAEPLP